VVTVKHPVQLPLWPPGSVTVMLRAPTVAPVVRVMLTVIWVLLLKVVELTVMPDPENATVAPLTKKLPVMAMFWLVAPWPRELGVAEATVGTDATVKQFEHEPAPVSGFVTVMLRVPVVALVAIVMLTVIWVLLLKVVELTVMPDPENVTVAPLTTLAPVIETLWVVFRKPKFGVAEVTVGAGATVKQFEHEPAPVSGFVTVMLRAPVVAPAVIVMLTVIWVLLLKVVELTVIPVPENVATAPTAKLVPVRVMLPVKPWGRAFGLAEAMVGATTVTDVRGLSGPDQLPRTGVTEYCHTPFGTPVSVHDSATTVPVQFGPTVCCTPDELYRFTTYPLTACPLGTNLLVDHETVTEEPAALAFGATPAATV
jgi:hypothetical protein